ncbi:MAG: DUF4476 domain-containing protein [Bacteroidota bacterium]
MNRILRLSLVLFLAGIGTATFAQFSNLIVFTQENQPFTVILNGIQQNPSSETNVKITGLKAPSYKVKIIFGNEAIPEIGKTVYLQPETESTYEILKNNKGLFVLRMMNSIPIDAASEPVAGQDIYTYTTTPRISSTTISQTTTTVNAGGFTGGTSITTTTTETSSNGGSQGTIEVSSNNNQYNNRDKHNGGGGEWHKDRDSRNRHEGNKNHDDGERDDYSGPRGCPKPMGQQAFDQALESISSKSFTSSKMTVARQVVRTNCLRCSQVKEIMKQFSFESDKLEIAKFAYKHTWDVNNYFLLNDAFEFDSTIDDLNSFILKK